MAPSSALPRGARARGMLPQRAHPEAPAALAATPEPLGPTATRPQPPTFPEPQGAPLAHHSLRAASFERGSRAARRVSAERVRSGARRAPPPPRAGAPSVGAGRPSRARIIGHGAPACARRAGLGGRQVERSETGGGIPGTFASARSHQGTVYTTRAFDDETVCTTRTQRNSPLVIRRGAASGAASARQRHAWVQPFVVEQRCYSFVRDLPCLG